MKGNLIKKTAAFIMALCILSGGLPQTTGKVSLTKFNLTADAADSTVSFDEERGTLILSGNVNKDDVIAYADNEKVKTVYCKQGTVFPEDCSEMFQYFRATDFDLHDADTSKVTDMNYMFNCSCAELITLTGWDTSKVTNMNYMFCDCSGLQFIFVNDKWKINDKNTLAGTFDGCTKLKGENGTKVDTSLLDYKEFARLDFEGTPGYLSHIHEYGKWEYYSGTCDKDLTSIRTCPVCGKSEFISPGKKIEHEWGEWTVAKEPTATETGLKERICSVCGEKETEVIPATGEVHDADVHAIEFDEETGVLTLNGKLPDTIREDLLPYAKNEAVTSIVCTEGTVFPEDCTYLFLGYNTDTDERYWENVFSIDLSKADTSNVKVMNFMFLYLLDVASINVSGWNTENVTDMVGTFYGCSNITSLDLRSFDTKNVEDMSCMFLSCRSLTQIAVSDKWNTDSVKHSSDMFYNCYSIQGKNGTGFDVKFVDGTYAHIDTAENPGYLTDEIKNVSPITVFDKATGTLTLNGNVPSSAIKAYNKLPGVEKIVAAEGTVLPEDCSFLFDGYNPYNTNSPYWTDLEVIDLSKADTSKVKDMSCMFRYLKKLNTFDISGFDTSNVTNMIYMFEDCESLNSIDLRSFDTSKVENMSYMFKNCTNLCQIVVSDKWSTDAVTSSEDMFYNCPFIVGKNGTPYSSSNTNHEYARIDTEETPGYFTDKKPAFQSAVLLPNGTLMLYGDIKESEVGKSINMEAKKVIAAKGSVLPEDCDGLFQEFKSASIDLSNADSSKVVKASNMFNQCTNLTDLRLGNFDASRVKSFWAMFNGCKRLKYLDISMLDTSNVTNMKFMFSGCSSLETIVVGDKWDTSKVTISDRMFEGCTELLGANDTAFDAEKIDITMAHVDTEEVPGYLTKACTKFDKSTETLTLYGDVSRNALIAFLNDQYVSDGDLYVTHITCEKGTVLPKNCSGLFGNYFWSTETIDLSNADTSNVENMNGMFYDCSRLTSIDLSSFKTSNVKYMTFMFVDCPELTSLDLNSFDTSNVISMLGIFSGCTKLSSIIVSNRWNMDNVTANKYMFDGCTALVGQKGTAYSLDKTDGEYARIDSADAPGYFTAGSMVTFDEETGTLTLGGNVLKSDVQVYWCNSSVKKVVCAEGTVLPKDCSLLFDNFLGAETIDLSNADTSNVTDMSVMFSNCPELVSINMKNIDTSKVTNMLGMFYDCPKLESLDLSNFDTRNVTNMSSMFESCEALTTLDVSSFDTSNVTNMLYMFYECKAIKKLDLSNFNTKNVKILYAMFDKCESIESIDLSSFDTSNVKDTCYMFAYCENLNKILVSDKWSTANITDGYYMFENCSKLTGGLGTKFDPDKRNKEYARVDMPDAPGYLTDYEVDKAVTLIDELGTFLYTDEKKQKYTDAVLAFESLTKEKQEFVTNASVLLKANDDISIMNSIIAYTDDIYGHIQETDKYDMESLKKAIDEVKKLTVTLSEEQVASIPNYGQFQVCEKYYNELETANKNAEEAATQKAAAEKAAADKAAAEKEAAAQKKAAETAAAAQKKAEEAQAKAEAELAAANKTLTETKAELETAQTDLTAAQKSLDKTNADLKTANASVADLEKQLAAANEKVEALEAGAEADEVLQKEVSDLKEQLAAAKTTQAAAEKAQAAAESDAKTAQANAEKAAAAQKKAEEAQAKAEKELEELKASLVKTTVKIGDVDMDGTVDTKDAMLFTRYYNGDEGAKIDLRAADIDRDGEVTLRDVMILTRYVNGWEGYDTYIVDAEI